MIIVIIISLLLLASLAIVIANANKPNAARSWLIALVSAFLVWVGVFGLRLFLPSQFPLIAWNAGDLFVYDPFLVINYNSWPYALALSTLSMAVIFTDSTRSFTQRSASTWVGALLITAINLVGLLAGDPITLAIIWVVVDITELVYLYLNTRDGSFSSRITTVFGIRLFSTFGLIFAIIVGWQVQPGFSLAEIPASAGIYFLLAAGLRLGVLPISLPYITQANKRLSTELLFRFAPVASSLMVIANLPAGILDFQPGWSRLFVTLTVFAALYASGMWLTRSNSQEGRPYWIVTLSAFAIMSALNGQAGTSRAWGVALLLSGGVLFLFDPPIRRIRFLPALGIFGLLGLPYTLAATGWAGILGTSFSLTSALLLLAHAMLVAGYLRFLNQAGTTITGLEKHARITYPMGLILIVQTLLVIGIVGWPGVLAIGTWWAGLASALLVIVGILVVITIKWQRQIPSIRDGLPILKTFKIVSQPLSTFFSLTWLYKLAAFVLRQLSRLGSLFSTVIEGEGGILWSFVFLTIFVLLFLSGVSQP